MLFNQRNKRILDGIITNEKLAHGYIFSGSIGSFVKCAANYFAQSLHCLDFQNNPCGKCEICQNYERKIFFDLYTVTDEKQIVKENIKELQQHIKYGPIKYKKLIVIIPNTNLLNEHSANAFLKTLEEPPDNVIFILITSNSTEILPTIRSRCQIFDFPSVTAKELNTHLDSLPVEQKEEILKKCFNNLELVKYYLDYEYLLDEDIYISFSDFIKKHTLEKLDYAARLSTDKNQARLILILWLRELIANVSTEKNNKLFLQKIVENILQMKYNLNLKLHLESLLINL